MSELILKPLAHVNRQSAKKIGFSPMCMLPDSRQVTRKPGDRKRGSGKGESVLTGF